MTVISENLNLVYREKSAHPDLTKPARLLYRGR